MAGPGPKVEEVMVRDLITVESRTSVIQAAKLMAEKDCGCLLVVHDGHVSGIVTERDLVRKVIAEGFDPSKILIGDIMSTPLITIEPSAPLEDAARSMARHKVRRLPVVDQGRLVGLLTSTDIALYLVKAQDMGVSLLNAIARRGEGPYA